MVLRVFWGWYLYGELKKLLPPDKRVDPQAHWNSSEFLECLEELGDWRPSWRERELDEDRAERVRLVLQHIPIYRFIQINEQHRIHGEEKMSVVMDGSSILEDYVWLIDTYPDKFIEFATFSNDTLDYLDVLRVFVFNEVSPPEAFREEVWQRVEEYVRDSAHGLINVLEHHALQLDPPAAILTLLERTLSSWDELPKNYADRDSYKAEEFWAPTYEQWDRWKKACTWALDYQKELYIG